MARVIPQEYRLACKAKQYELARLATLGSDVFPEMRHELWWREHEVDGFSESIGRGCDEKRPFKMSFLPLSVLRVCMFCVCAASCE